MAREFLREVFDLYKSQPCLWNLKHKDYKNEDSNDIAIMKLTLKYQEVFIGATRKNVTMELKTYRKDMLKEHLILKKEGSTAKSKLWYYDDLLFIVEKGADVQKKYYSKQSQEEKSKSQKRSNDDAGAPAQKRIKVVKDKYDKLDDELRTLSAEKYACIENILDSVFKFAHQETKELLNSRQEAAQSTAANTATQSENVVASVLTNLNSPRGSNCSNMPTSSTSTRRQEAPHPVAVSPAQDALSNTVDAQMASVPTGLNSHSRPNSTSTSRQEAPHPIAVSPVQDAPSNTVDVQMASVPTSLNSHRRPNSTSTSRQEAPHPIAVSPVQEALSSTVDVQMASVPTSLNCHSRPNSASTSRQEAPHPIAVSPFQDAPSNTVDAQMASVPTSLNCHSRPNSTSTSRQEAPHPIAVSPAQDPSSNTVDTQPTAANTEVLQKTFHVPDSRTAPLWINLNRPCGPSYLIIPSNFTIRQESLQPIAMNPQTVQDPSYSSNTQMASEQAIRSSPSGSNSMNTPSSASTSRQEAHQPITANSVAVQETQSNTTDYHITSVQNNLNRPPGSNSLNMLKLSTDANRQEVPQSFAKNTEPVHETQSNTNDTQITPIQTNHGSICGSNSPNMLISPTITNIQEGPQLRVVKTKPDQEAQSNSVDSQTMSVQTNVRSPSGSNPLNIILSVNNASRQEAPESTAGNIAMSTETQLRTVASPMISQQSDLYSSRQLNYVNKFPPSTIISRQDVFPPNTATGKKLSAKKKKSHREKITFEKNYDLSIPHTSNPPGATSSRKPDNVLNRISNQHSLKSNQQNSTNTSKDQNQYTPSESQVIVLSD